MSEKTNKENQNLNKIIEVTLYINSNLLLLLLFITIITIILIIISLV